MSKQPSSTRHRICKSNVACGWRVCRRKPFGPQWSYSRPHAVSGFFATIARPPALADMSSLQLADLRAFLAARRHSGAQSRSLNRSVSGLRNFARFLERRDTPVSPAFNLLSVPKTTRSLPRPVAQNDALAMIRLALESASAVWVGRRDAALLCLLYGAGLRVSEALQLDVKAYHPHKNEPCAFWARATKNAKSLFYPLRQTLMTQRAAPFGLA